MKCKGKVQKGKCRQGTKASAERQVQTGNPHRTQTRSVASDHVRIAYAHSAWPGFRAASFANFYQNRTKMEPKSTTNGTNLAQWGGKGQPKINTNIKKYKKRKRKEPK